MGYFYVGVGGSGAKLMHTLVHLTAAGLLSANGGRQSLLGYLVDPDKSNGNIDECKRVLELYTNCQRLQFGDKATFFSNDIQLEGPWSPVEDERANLMTVFGYKQMQQVDTEDADLMDILFTKEEREMSMAQGFRGRPAVGAAVFSHAVSFDANMWQDLVNSAQGAQANGDVSILLAGSVFGGSGAAGVPTLCRLLKDRLAQNISNLRMGMVLFLPYFTYDKVENENLQADPNGFAVAAAEALKYYEEGHFFDICDSIYVVGDTPTAKMPVPAVGAKDQCNPPHYVEFISGLGALRFLTMSWGTDGGKKGRVVSLASREDPNTLTWSDLPIPAQPGNQLALLRQFIQFAVAYHFVVFPFVKTCKDVKHPLTDLLGDTPWDKAIADMQAVDDYLVSFLQWLLAICTPPRDAAGTFSNGLIEVGVIADGDGNAWHLKTVREFKEDRFPSLFLHMSEYRRPNLRRIFQKATLFVNDQNIGSAGMLVRAIYEACSIS